MANWKYILIIIILAVIVGAGALWMSKQEIPLVDFLKRKKPKEPAEIGESINIGAYQQAQTQVDFPVFYPTYLPEGFEFEKKEVNEGVGEGDYGNLTVTYKADGGRQIQIMEGSGDVGAVDFLRSIDLSEGKGSLWRAGKYLGISLTSISTTSYNYVIMTEKVGEDELIKIADSVNKLK